MDKIEPAWRTDEPPRDRYILAIISETGWPCVICWDDEYWVLLGSNEFCGRDDPIRWTEALYPALGDGYVSLSGKGEYVLPLKDE